MDLDEMYACFYSPIFVRSRFLSAANVSMSGICRIEGNAPSSLCDALPCSAMPKGIATQY